MASNPQFAGRGLARTTLPTGGAMQRAFWLQYISLMLMILTFMVASFGRARMEPIKAEAKPSPPVALAKLAPPLGVQESENIFDPVFAEINDTSLLEAVKQVLLHHDLFATVEICGPSGSAQTLGRAALVGKWFGQNEVPLEAWEVAALACEPVRAGKIKIRWRHARE